MCLYSPEALLLENTGIFCCCFFFFFFANIGSKIPLFMDSAEVERTFFEANHQWGISEVNVEYLLLPAVIYCYRKNLTFWTLGMLLPLPSIMSNLIDYTLESFFLSQSIWELTTKNICETLQPVCYGCNIYSFQTTRWSMFALVVVLRGGILKK